MTVDLDVDFDYGMYAYAQYSNSNANDVETHQTSFHKTILAEKPSLSFSRTATHRGYYTTCEDRTNDVYMQTVGGEWDVRAGVTWKWETDRGVDVHLFADGGIRDDNGNGVRGKVEGWNGKAQGEFYTDHKGRFGEWDSSTDHKHRNSDLQ